MSALASNRAVPATVLLALVVAGGCLAMASAVPVANGRRLQQLAVNNDVAAGGGQTSQLQALTAGLQKLSDQVKIALQRVSVSAGLLGQLQKVASSFDEAQRQLQSDVQSLLSLPAIVLNLPENQLMVQNLLTELAAKLQLVSTQFQNPQPVDGCFRTLKDNLLGEIRDMTSKLTSDTAGLPISMQPAALIVDLQGLGDAVGQVDPCAAGLETIPSNGQDVLVVLGELVVAIQ